MRKYFLGVGGYGWDMEVYQRMNCEHVHAWGELYNSFSVTRKMFRKISEHVGFSERLSADCCDQLFPGFKTTWLWVAQQCTSSTPPPISHSVRHVDGSDLDNVSNGGGNKCTKAANLRTKTVPKIYRPLSKSMDLVAKRMAKLAACCPV